MDKTLEKLEDTEDSWETNASIAKFYGFSLEQYKAEVQLSRDARELVASCKQQLQAAKIKCKDTDTKNLSLEKNIAKAIAGDKDFGDDSALYEGTGRIRRSERKTGLKRLKKNVNNDG
jgi:hypothetical protein